MVSVVARICFCDGRTDVRTPCVKIMTTFSAVAWWVNKPIGYSRLRVKKNSRKVELNRDRLKEVLRSTTEVLPSVGSCKKRGKLNVKGLDFTHFFVSEKLIRNWILGCCCCDCQLTHQAPAELVIISFVVDVRPSVCAWIFVLVQISSRQKSVST